MSSRSRRRSDPTSTDRVAPGRLGRLAVDAADGSATVGGGLLTVDGAFAATSTSYTPGRSLEFVATFQAVPFQHVGFAVDLNGAPWAIFSTGSDGATLKARTNDGSSNDHGHPRKLVRRAAPVPDRLVRGQVVYSIDGTVVATHTANLPGVDAPGGERRRPRRTAARRRLARHVAVHVAVRVPVAHVRRGLDRRTGPRSTAS